LFSFVFYYVDRKDSQMRNKNIRAVLTSYEKKQKNQILADSSLEHRNVQSKTWSISKKCFFSKKSLKGVDAGQVAHTKRGKTVPRIAETAPCTEEVCHTWWNCVGHVNLRDVYQVAESGWHLYVILPYLVQFCHTEEFFSFFFFLSRFFAR